MDMHLFKAAIRLLDGFADGLSSRKTEGVEETLSRLAQQDVSINAFSQPVPQVQPVCRYLPEVISEAQNVEANVSTALTLLSPHLRWVQSSSYTDALLGEGFSQNYAWCEIIGADGFFRGDDFNLGFLLLGPQRHYLDHYHPAPELYWPMTKNSHWKKGNGSFEAKAAGTVIWHPSMIVHATITKNDPLLAAFAWTRDASVGARLCALDK